jgi:hypothetical protein
MSPIITRLALEMARITLIIVTLFGLIWSGYYYLKSDIDLLNDETLIAIISNDVLGNSQYGNSCSRTSYEKNVISELGGTKGSGYFTFNPIQGQEIRCPPISIIVSRRTGEAWVAGK